ncbi:MAG: hypothetical protein ACXWUR_03890 [Allosphingosinicella sp.]
MHVTFFAMHVAWNRSTISGSSGRKNRRPIRALRTHRTSAACYRFFLSSTNTIELRPRHLADAARTAAGHVLEPDEGLHTAVAHADAVAGKIVADVEPALLVGGGLGELGRGHTFAVVVHPAAKRLERDVTLPNRRARNRRSASHPQNRNVSPPLNAQGSR